MAISKETIITKFSKQTKKFAGLLAKKALRNYAYRQAGKKQKSALVFALVGDLGSGKTTFVQGFMRAMGIRKKITSPTFVLVKSYKVKSYKVYHIDCYRIRKSVELLKLGFKEIIGNPQSIVLIEWADRIRKILPRGVIWIEFRHGDKVNQRFINVKFKI